MDADVGFFLVARKTLSFALVAYNLFTEDADRSMLGRMHSKRTALAANYLFGEIVRLRLDLLSGSRNQWKRYTTMMGYEILMNQWWRVHLGGFRNLEEDTEAGTVGFGLDLPRFRLNYAYQTGSTAEVNGIHSG
jgi:hypothetical protein